MLNDGSHSRCHNRALATKAENNNRHIHLHFYDWNVINLNVMSILALNSYFQVSDRVNEYLQKREAWCC